MMCGQMTVLSTCHSQLRSTARRLVEQTGYKGMSGTLVQTSVETVFHRLLLLGLTEADTIVDAGSGDGQLTSSMWLLACHNNSVPRLLGFELCETNAQKSNDLVAWLYERLLTHNNPSVRQFITGIDISRKPIFQQQDVADMASLPPGTSVVTAFCVGWSRADLEKLCCLCQQQASLRFVVWISYSRIGLQHQIHPGLPGRPPVYEHPVKMRGSGERYRAYYLPFH